MPKSKRRSSNKKKRSINIKGRNFPIWLPAIVPIITVLIVLKIVKAETLCTATFQHTATPLTDMSNQPYTNMLGQTFPEYEGGLYANGSNVPPAEHLSAGLQIANEIIPLDLNGNPNEDGDIVMVSVGMSNTKQEFTAFKNSIRIDPEMNPKVKLINLAQANKTSDVWADPGSAAWTTADEMLINQNSSPLQVQVVWLKQAQRGLKDFPEEMLDLELDLENIVRNIKDRYPNTKVVFFSSRTNSYKYNVRSLSSEPTAFETGFAVKEVIQKQIEGDLSLNWDSARGPVEAPYLVWGPYLWADGINPRSDGFVWPASNLVQDCIHPSTEGELAVSGLLTSFFKTDPLTAPWFLAPLVTSTPTPEATPTSTGSTPTTQPPTPTSGGEPTATPRPTRTPISTPPGGR